MAKNATTMSRLSASSQAARVIPIDGQVQIVAGEERHRDVRPLKEGVDRQDHDLEGDRMVQVGMK